MTETLNEVNAANRKRRRDPMLGGGQTRRGSGESDAASHKKNYSSDEWYTPGFVMDAVREVLGGIDVDPASCEIANETVKAATFYTAENSGLDKPWTGTVWLNPPYSRPLATQFADKLIEELDNGNTTSAVMVQNSGTDTGWYHRLLSKCSAICLSRGRISFLQPDGSSGANRYGQTFFYFGDDIYTFSDVFSKYGTILAMERAYDGDKK